MRSYEVAFIAQPDLDDSSLNTLVEKAKGWVAATGGQVTQVDVWGRRRLAYPIRKQKEGQYILMQTQMTSAAQATAFPESVARSTGTSHMFPIQYAALRPPGHLFQRCHRAHVELV
ncbi:MAG: 30S ribosomal protein S6 [Chloroflexi bacterium]|nr:30S ribosomal protein S6 [Chloroflexota bacterium]